MNNFEINSNWVLVVLFLMAPTTHACMQSAQVQVNLSGEERNDRVRLLNVTLQTKSRRFQGQSSCNLFFINAIQFKKKHTFRGKHHHHQEWEWNGNALTFALAFIWHGKPAAEINAPIKSRSLIQDEDYYGDGIRVNHRQLFSFTISRGQTLNHFKSRVRIGICATGTGPMNEIEGSTSLSFSDILCSRLLLGLVWLVLHNITALVFGIPGCTVFWWLQVINWSIEYWNVSLFESRRMDRWKLLVEFTFLTNLGLYLR